MPFIDERGRLFGKINLIDAGVGVLILLLIPLGYAGYRLFRTPIPTITAVTPARLQRGDDVRVRVEGEDLRPYLKVKVGTKTATFFLESPKGGRSPRRWP